MSAGNDSDSTIRMGEPNTALKDTCAAVVLTLAVSLLLQGSACTALQTASRCCSRADPMSSQKPHCGGSTGPPTRSIRTQTRQAAYFITTTSVSMHDLHVPRFCQPACLSISLCECCCPHSCLTSKCHDVHRYTAFTPTTTQITLRGCRAMVLVGFFCGSQ